jgi:glycolate oxidase
VNAPIQELAAQLPGGVLVTEAATSEAYRFDSASFCPAGTPIGVARPTTTEQVQTILRWASRHRVPVVPQGARTGLSGGANAVDGALLLSLVRMNRILTIDQVDQIAVVQPASSTPTSPARSARSGCSTRPIRRPGRCRPSAATWRPTPVACAASSTA